MLTISDPGARQHLYLVNVEIKVIPKIILLNSLWENLKTKTTLIKEMERIFHLGTTKESGQTRIKIKFTQAKIDEIVLEIMMITPTLLFLV